MQSPRTVVVLRSFAGHGLGGIGILAGSLEVERTISVPFASSVASIHAESDPFHVTLSGRIRSTV
jgi:hypothetical protein